MIDSCRQIIDQLSKMAAGVGVFCSSHSLRLIVLVAIASCRTEEVLNGRELQQRMIACHRLLHQLFSLCNEFCLWPSGGS